jgi:hypothetical protein
MGLCVNFLRLEVEMFFASRRQGKKISLSRSVVTVQECVRLAVEVFTGQRVFFREIDMILRHSNSEEAEAREVTFKAVVTLEEQRRSGNEFRVETVVTVVRGEDRIRRSKWQCQNEIFSLSLEYMSIPYFKRFYQVSWDYCDESRMPVVKIGQCSRPSCLPTQSVRHIRFLSDATADALSGRDVERRFRIGTSWQDARDEVRF